MRCLGILLQIIFSFEVSSIRLYFSREMFRLQKVFRARGKQLEAGNAQSRKANEGASQMAASLKMCQRGLDDVKEFKVRFNNKLPELWINSLRFKFTGSATTGRCHL